MFAFIKNDTATSHNYASHYFLCRFIFGGERNKISLLKRLLFFLKPHFLRWLTLTYLHSSYALNSCWLLNINAFHEIYFLSRSSVIHMCRVFLFKKTISKSLNHHPVWRLVNSHWMFLLGMCESAFLLSFLTEYLTSCHHKCFLTFFIR